MFAEEQRGHGKEASGTSKAKKYINISRKDDRKSTARVVNNK